MPANTTLPLPSKSLSLADPGLALVTLEQERFNRFIWSENERLNRLIRNLYLYLLQFEHYSERDLYDRICQEVAEYFRASSCELYLVRYEEGEVDPPDHKFGPPTWPSPERKYKLTKWLELVGAYGQGRRALQRRYVRHADRLRYEIPLDPPANATSLPKMTRMGFINEGPSRYASGYDHRAARHTGSKTGRSEKSSLHDEASRQVVWYQDGLHNSFRCNLMAPIVREGRQGDSATRTPYYRRIGLIKVENRLPHGVAGFGETLRVGTDQSYLYFLNEWRIAALRPYVRDLPGSAKPDASPFFPLHNNVGWRQYFDDHPLGAEYFRQLLHELDQRAKGAHHAPNKRQIEEELKKGYGEFSTWLENLVECLIRLESWIQHLGYACRLLCGLGETPSLDKPIPSLFNVYNLRAAYLFALSDEHGQKAVCEIESEARVSTKQAPMYQTVRDALFDCVASGRTKDRTYLGLLEMIWHDVQKTNRRLDNLSSEALKDSVTKQEFRKWLVTPQGVRSEKLRREVGELSKKLRPLLDGRLPASEDLPHTLENLRESLDTIRVLAEQEAEQLIQALCCHRATTIRAKLGATSRRGSLYFDIPRALIGVLPKWDFDGAMKDEVLDSLERICGRLENKHYAEQTDSPEFRAEEFELHRVGATVQSILCDDEKALQHRGAGCTLPDIYRGTHEPEENTGCKTARALAAAVMYADSFSPLDEKRLVFISSHVTHVLDNYLLHQARQRELDIDYQALDILGLEHFGLELIDTLWSCAQRMESALVYLLKREFYAIGIKDMRLHCTSRPLKELTAAIKSSQDSPIVDSSQQRRPNDTVSHQLILISFDSVSGFGGQVKTHVDLDDVIGRVFKHIRDGAYLVCHDLRVAETPFTVNSHGVEFKLGELPDDYDFATIRLSLGSDPKIQDGAADIELRVNLDRHALQDRDVRALWVAVNTMEEVLKATQRSAGVGK